MADFATIDTNRYRIRYSTGGKAHHAAFRYPGDASPPPSATTEAVEAFLTALKDLRFSDWTLLGTEHALKNTPFYLPSLAISPAGGTADSGNAVALSPVSISFVGKTFAGNRMSVYLYGVSINPLSNGFSGDFRLTAGENSGIAAAVDALNTSGAFCGIDGVAGTWYPYANISVNAYYQKRKRG